MDMGAFEMAFHSSYVSEDRGMANSLYLAN